MPDDKFIPGLELSRRFYLEVVKPILDKDMPDLKYAAGLIGYGSEVLGFDTQQSVDHHWGPRMLMFLSEEDYKSKKVQIDEILSNNLPYNFLGFTTNYSEGDEIGIRHAQPITDGPVRHFVEVYTVRSYLEKRLGICSLESLSDKDWVNFSQQRLLETVSGEVFVDRLGTVEEMRKTLKYYPHNIWLAKMAAQWQKIGVIEAFVGRCGDVGDEIGSRLVATEVIKSIMKLCFMMEKRYIPYLKWLGSAFKKLESSQTFLTIFDDVLSAENWKDREKYLSRAYEKIAQMHNALDITDRLPENVQDYYGRPYKVIRADLFSQKINEKIGQDIKDLIISRG